MFAIYGTRLHILQINRVTAIITATVFTTDSDLPLAEIVRGKKKGGIMSREIVRVIRRTDDIRFTGEVGIDLSNMSDIDTPIQFIGLKNTHLHSIGNRIKEDERNGYYIRRGNVIHDFFVDKDLIIDSKGNRYIVVYGEYAEDIKIYDKSGEAAIITSTGKSKYGDEGIAINGNDIVRIYKIKSSNVDFDKNGNAILNNVNDLFSLAKREAVYSESLGWYNYGE